MQKQHGWKRATKPLLNQRQRQKRLTWAVEKKELSGPKSSFQMKVNFAFHLEIKVPESGGKNWSRTVRSKHVKHLWFLKYAWPHQMLCFSNKEKLHPHFIHSRALNEFHCNAVLLLKAWLTQFCMAHPKIKSKSKSALLSILPHVPYIHTENWNCVTLLLPGAYR